MKEDVLEQLVDDYLKLQGYFTAHNVKFHPKPGDRGYDKQQDCVPSDIDVIGYHPRKTGVDRVWVVGCKSWQGGFDADWWGKNATTNRKTANKPAWKHFRELANPKWTNAFLREIESLTGSRKFTYVTCVTKYRGNRESWEQNAQLIHAIEGNPIRIRTLEDIVELVRELTTTTPAPSDIGRMVQLLKSAGLI